MSDRTAWRFCAAAGVVAFFCSWLFGQIPGLVACGPTGGLSPIIAFEFVRTPADVATLFGSDPCRSALVAAQKTGLLLDEFGFIPAYTAFLVLGTWATRARGFWPMAVVVALTIAGVSDEVEGVILYFILRDLPGTQTLIDWLWWAVHVKFVLLALGTMCIGPLLALSKGRLAGFFGIPIWAGAVAAFYGLGHFPNTTMMTGFVLAWVALLVAALIASFAPRFFSPRPS
ncbi:hypothetical protein G4G27_21175 [Sphingomonas sp. So64.6b]|uniref:hypothetical protein n=1 Tax=Sphingomonas sp. So64.6b TaxID=2997354 RepID=UPI001603329D|nr:hypothetical protein [Sphingomonas sp. So64.6b]QNA86213.1 hypothetical protein G4G27_21175 [Sphingomonas sp. So64.6b]